MSLRPPLTISEISAKFTCVVPEHEAGLSKAAPSGSLNKDTISVQVVWYWKPQASVCGTQDSQGELEGRGEREGTHYFG